jgi:hypothetical protein
MDPQGGFALLTHEAVHLTHGRARPQEASWIREGLALLGETLITGYFNPVVGLGFASPETSLMLTVDPALPESEAMRVRGPQYGHVLQYFYYLYRLCGGDSLYETLFEGADAIDRTLEGPAFIDAVLKRQLAESSGADPSVCSNFEGSFVAFERARLKQYRLRPSDYVMISGFEAPLRASPPRADELPLWSATQYRPSPNSGKCEPGDESWRNRCLRIRKGK